ncbi:MAG: sensor domain-containing diguanylate cyclase [Planctomycetota bacterium]|jgi:diguanylate cyclase (GGDEF)-like protein
MVDTDRILQIIGELKSGADAGELGELVTGLIHEKSGLSSRVRRLDHDLRTIVELTRQINEKSLDLEGIENFTLNMVMGHFLIPKVFIMRQDDHSDNRFVVSKWKNMERPDIHFDAGDTFANKILEIGKPFGVDGAEKGEAMISRLQKLGVKTCIPLVKRDQETTFDLKGLLCLGPKIGAAGLSETEEEFLDLLGRMIAISLHNAQLYHKSIFDGLTRVYSRGHFDLQLSQEVERVKRYRRMTDFERAAKFISLIILDIDDFKKCNDTYGHQAGDAVLRALAQIVQVSIRACDAVARYGGEEFCIILPETPKARAVEVAQRICDEIAASMIETTDAGDLHTTVSMGVATFPDDAESVQSLLREADKALYVAKEQGKNRVIPAPSLKASG